MTDEEYCKIKANVIERNEKMKAYKIIRHFTEAEFNKRHEYFEKRQN